MIDLLQVLQHKSIIINITWGCQLRVPLQISSCSPSIISVLLLTSKRQRVYGLEWYALINCLMYWCTHPITIILNWIRWLTSANHLYKYNKIRSTYFDIRLLTWRQEGHLQYLKFLGASFLWGLETRHCDAYLCKTIVLPQDADKENIE